MAGPLTVSALFHLVIVLLCIFGLPYIKKDPPDLPDPLSVEIVKVEDAPAAKPPPRSELKQPPSKLEKPPELKPVTPQMTAEKPPKPAAAAAPDEESVALPREETPKPAEPPKPKKAPKPDKPPVNREIAEEETPQEDFQTVLKNLMPAEPVAAASPDTPEDAKELSPLEKRAQQLSMGEHDALRRQLSQCWSLLAGARYAEDLVVDIRLTMNPDRTIRDAQIVDQVRYFRDNYFKAAADGALRAVRNPRCNPLELPPQKYEQWKTITVTFDPREML